MKYICLILGIFLINGAFCQQKESHIRYPEAGYPCPYFEIEGINDFKLTKASPNDFIGKWLVIDFWDKNCMTCIENLPEINILQKKYKSEVQYLLIGREDENGAIRKIYEKFKNRLKLQIPNAFDSSIFRRFDFSTCPRIIVVAPNGIVYGITNKLSDDNISALLTGKKPILEKGYRENEDRPTQHFLNATDINGDSTLLFASMLNKWNSTIKGTLSWKVIPKNGHFETVMSNLNHLYMLAYFGQDAVYTNDSLYGYVYGTPILEVSDKIRLEKEIDSESYCYRVTVPSNKNSKKDIMRVMQNDLKNYFGYDANIELRMMPYWKLVANDDARFKLKTKGGTRTLRGRIDTGFVVKNYPIKDIISALYFLKLPVTDETGIEGNIDLELKYLLTNIYDIQRGLSENGLSLIKSEKKMKVLVIKDPTSQ